MSRLTRIDYWLIALALGAGLSVAQADETEAQADITAAQTDKTEATVDASNTEASATDTASADGTNADAEKTTFEANQKLTLQGGYGPEDGVLGNSHKGFYGVRYEPTLFWYSPDKQWSTWQGFLRAWINYNSGQVVTPLDDPNAKQVEYFSAEAREFYIKRNLIGDDPRFSAALGRQKFSDHYGIWWDDSIESLRFNYQDSFSNGFIAVAQKFRNYNTDINSLDQSERSILYGMAEYGWRWNDKNWAGMRLLLENDHGGTRIDDPVDFNGGRVGLFFYGDHLDGLPYSDYRVEAVSLAGTSDVTDASGATHEESSQGWALVGDIGKRFDDIAWSPRIGLRGGITDQPNDDFDGFGLNHIQSDRVNNPETYSSGLVGSFVSVDFRNMAFYGIALETQPTERNYLDLRFFDLYRRVSDVSLPLRVKEEAGPAANDSIGQILDLNYYWKMFPYGYRGDQIHLNILVSAGYFWAGDAVQEPNRDDFQLFLGVDLRY